MELGNFRRCPSALSATVTRATLGNFRPLPLLSSSNSGNFRWCLRSDVRPAAGPALEPPACQELLRGSFSRRDLCTGRRAKRTERYIKAAQGLLGLFARRSGRGRGRERVCLAVAAMGFGDLKSAAGLRVLNDFLADRSYIEGYVPSQADIAVFEAIAAPPPADLFHALRWYNHIKSYEKQKASLPGVKKALGKYGPADVEDTTGAATDSKDDDDIDLFGSDDEEESEEAKKLREERLAQYESKKSKKPAVVAKSSILLDVKPWDDETDMAKLEECVRSIQADGLVWGSSKLVPVGYGIKKLQIQCVVEDDKVGTDMLEERITAFEDYVQSMDVAAFNKI